MFVSCECCVLSGSGICDGPNPRPETPTDCVFVFVIECEQVQQ